MIGVDVGGTFTDVVEIRDGRVSVTKVPSSQTDPAQAVVEGARRLGVEGVPVFNHASTMGLNAVITRQLPKVAFLTTDGHRDMLDRGRVWRPPDRQTDPSWRRPFGDASKPLVPRYLRRGVPERIAADGSVLMALDETEARRQLAVFGRCNVEGVAICLLNAYVNHAHEERLRELVHEVLGDVPVSISSETSPLAKEYARASTTVIDVVMKLIFDAYSHRIDDELRALGFRGELNFADCAATLLPWREALRKPSRIVFAGPAAGTIASTRLGEAIGDRNLICADVGGTSTDVSLVVDGRPFLNNTFELEHDLVINALSTEVVSVGAGGGSIVGISPSGDVTVGPGSVGSEPGPACYGRGGTLPAVTDACLLMGILAPEGFAAGQVRLDPALARRAFEGLDTPLPVDRRIAFAFRIAVANIAEEIANIAIRHGVDPRDFSLMSYGAAGGMLLPATLDLLHVRRVVIPPHPGLFSALGLLSTDRVYYDSRSAYVLLTPQSAPQIAAVYELMEQRLRARAGVGRDAEDVTLRRSFDGRLVGHSWETPFIEIPSGPITGDTVQELVERFHDVYERRYGNRFPYVPVQGVTYRVELVVRSEKVQYAAGKPERTAQVRPEGMLDLRHYADEPLQAAEYRRESLPVGARVEGPAIIREALSTTFVCPGQVAEVGTVGEISIEAATRAAGGSDRWP
ncbi:MAG TPA: hydantoinase/oxoprolinase family protein [Solirubrobacteraceae bacterium]|nr:hydantoinase/oxoprolinase family protein [Solirubrobacteraceae bacterium]